VLLTRLLNRCLCGGKLALAFFELLRLSATGFFVSIVPLFDDFDSRKRKIYIPSIFGGSQACLDTD
jgi:hypothetical protein